MSQFPVSLPGIGTGLTLTPRNVFNSNLNPSDYFPGGVLIDGANARDPDNTLAPTLLRAGLLMGKVTSAVANAGGTTVVGTYAASVIGVLQAAINSSATAFTLTASQATELVRRLGSSGTLTVTSAPTATGTVAQTTVTYSAVNTSTGVVTITAGTAFTAGALVGATDGSQTPSTFIVNALSPLRVTDLGGNAVTLPWASVPNTSKQVLTANIVNYPASANTTLTIWVRQQLNALCPSMTFDDEI